MVAAEAHETWNRIQSPVKTTITHIGYLSLVYVNHHPYQLTKRCYGDIIEQKRSM
ncbi:unnamed protein product [Urochloa humidicola]